MERYELPDGWHWSTIGGAYQVNERDPKLRELADDLPVSFVPMAAVDGERGIIAVPEVRPLSQVRKGYKSFADGDVIFARITPCMENGKAAIACGLTSGLGFGSTEFHVMRPINGNLAEWLFYFVRREDFRNQAKANFTGTAGQLRVPDGFIRNASIPIAPPDEQRRIVEKIERLLAQSHTAREALDRIPPLLKKFRQAVLAAAFRGELAERDPNDEHASVLNKSDSQHPHISNLPDPWRWIQLGNLLTFVGSGITPKGGKKVYRSSGVPFIRSQNVYSSGLQLDDVAYVSPELHEEMSRTHLQAGDVLLNITGASIGRSTVVPPSLGPANVNQHVCILRPSRLADAEYLSWFLNSPLGQDQIMGLQSGVTRQGLNYSQIRSIVMPLAPVAEQRHIVAKVRALFAQADAIERAVEHARRRAEKVDQAILARAFRGEL
jgi:type I restriction enzyme, S subunit